MPDPEAADSSWLEANRGAMSRGLQYASGFAQRNYLTGPRPDRLGVVTGRLRNSIATDVQRTDSGIVGRIGSNMRYARYHEFGFQGVITVKGHTRIMGVVLKTGKVVSGRMPIKDRKGNVVGYKDRRPEAVKLGLSGYGSIQIVKAHSRRLDYAGRPFIRPALEKALPIIGREIESALSRPLGQ